jgi:hypothetical protein
MKQPSKQPDTIKPETPDAQAKRFRKAAREAGVDPKADIDEVMRRLAGQKKQERPAKPKSS